MSDDCPRCATLKAVVADAEAGAHEERLAKDAALRQAVAERKRADRLETELHEKHQAAEESSVVRQCLAVWVEHCYAGKTKPKVALDGKRAALVRKALAYEGIGPDDICDAFRGLGLLPCRDKWNNRSPVRTKDHERASNVSEVLRITKDEGLDEARLERFRDYYRRVQATPAQRLLEQWEQATAVANELFVILLRAQGKEEAARVIEGAHEAGHLFADEAPRLRLIEGEAA